MKSSKGDRVPDSQVQGRQDRRSRGMWRVRSIVLFVVLVIEYGNLKWIGFPPHSLRPSPPPTSIFLRK